MLGTKHTWCQVFLYKTKLIPFQQPAPLPQFGKSSVKRKLAEHCRNILVLQGYFLFILWRVRTSSPQGCYCFDKSKHVVHTRSQENHLNSQEYFSLSCGKCEPIANYTCRKCKLSILSALTPQPKSSIKR